MCNYYRGSRHSLHRLELILFPVCDKFAMNCVYHAYDLHLTWLGLTPNGVDWSIYRLAKAFTHGRQPQMTKGSMTPFIYSLMTPAHNLDMTIQHRIWRKEHYIADANNRVQRLIAKATDYGEEVGLITLRPSIHLDLFAHHAYFSDTGLRSSNNAITMAIQFKLI